MYKDKFKAWGWSKYLPKDRAQWMLNKAEQRNRQHPGANKKDTIFGYGGQVWTVERVRKSTQRAKITEGEAVIALDAPTPHDITYETPRAVPPSPGNVRSPEGPSAPRPADRWTPMPSSSNAQLHFLQSAWNGRSSLAEIQAIKREAHQLNLEGEVQGAEKRFREALAGFENLLSPTHEDTNAVGYELANFYAEHDRMGDADLVLNWMGQKHVERWGFDHQKTTTHFLHVAELFTSWSRNDDAATLLYRVLDAWDKRDSTKLNPEPHRVAQPQVIPLQTTPRQSKPEDMTRAFTETDDPRRVDYQLGLANARVTTNDETVEPLLLRLIEQCEKYPTKLDSQILQARCALVDLYRRLGDDGRAARALRLAQKALETVLASTAKKTEPLLDSCIHVAKLHMTENYSEVAEDIFQRIGDEAEDTFGTDHRVTIGILIHIGKTYQRRNMWTYAQPWFERALAASMTANGLENAMTKRLEDALEHQHYAVGALTHEELESVARARMDIYVI
ncbi:hypothetical protein K440DRAFT_22746 [Wilcoxina mikolae CBS 423.85]|nr:hypothetical protein K440DRAFT_22746 [Wilcoxina mikolae CBS 423.85]